jgi:hypothetical protein
MATEPSVVDDFIDDRKIKILLRRFGDLIMRLTEEVEEREGGGVSPVTAPSPPAISATELSSKEASADAATALASELAEPRPLADAAPGLGAADEQSEISAGTPLPQDDVFRAPEPPPLGPERPETSFITETRPLEDLPPLFTVVGERDPDGFMFSSEQRISEIGKYDPIVDKTVGALEAHRVSQTNLNNAVVEGLDNLTQQAIFDTYRLDEVVRSQENMR